jgi:hypothetical protein
MTDDEIRAVLAKQGKVAIIWCVGDVQSVRENLTDDEAMQVLEAAERDHDAGVGINWDTLESIADELFPDNQERTTDPQLLAAFVRDMAQKAENYQEFRAAVIDHIEGMEADGPVAAILDCLRYPDVDDAQAIAAKVSELAKPKEG